MRTAFLLAFILFLSNVSSAQFGGLPTIIRAGKEDASIITREYFRPLASGLGASVNSGWTGPADTTKSLHISVQLRGSFAIIPSSQKSFDLTNLSLRKVRPADPNAIKSPTFSGSKKAPDIVIVDNGVQVGRVTMPKGSGYGWIPVPQLQFSGNIFPKTQLKARLIPEISIGDYGSASQIGIAAGHRINSYLPYPQMPVDLSIVVGYNYLIAKREFNLDPPTDALPDPTYFGNYSNQDLRVEFNTFSIQMIARKKLDPFTFYGGLGVESSNMQVEVTGDYPIPVNGPAGTQTQTITDPIRYTQQGENAFNLTVGTAYSWNSLTILSDLVFSQIPVWNIGLEVQL